MVSFKGAHFAKDSILTYVRWYVAHPLSYRQAEDRMEERGISVDDATINRRVHQRLVHRLERMGYQVSLQPSVA